MRAEDPRRDPIRGSRSCTDVIFLLLFTIVLLVWAVLAGFAFHHADLKFSLNITDSEGIPCGRGDAEDRPYLYYRDLDECFTKIKQKKYLECVNTTRFCVPKCPSEKTASSSAPICFTSALLKLENFDGKSKELEYERLVGTKQCLNSTVPSDNLFSLCLPRPGKIYPDLRKAEGIIQLVTPDSLFRLIWDTKKTAEFVLGGLGVALILGFLWMLLMRFFAGIIVWVTVLSFFLISGFVTGYSAYLANKVYKDANNQGPFDPERIKEDIYYPTTRFEVLATVAFIFGLTFLIMTAILIFLRKRINIAIALLEQAAKSIAAIPSLIIFPVIPYVGAITTSVFAVTLSLLSIHLSYLAQRDPAVIHRSCMSAVDFTESVDPGNGTMTVRHRVCEAMVSALSHVVYVNIFNVVAAVWCFLFLGSFGFFVTAHSVSTYFWTRKSEMQCFNVLTSIGVALSYHLGSLAFGSFALTGESIFKWLFLGIQRKHRDRDESFLRYCFKCCSCCFMIIDRFYNYVSRNGFIMMAMYGKSFCRSSYRAFKLIVGNVLRAFVVTKVTDFIIWLAQLVNAFVAAAVTYFVFSNQDIKKELNVPDIYWIGFPVFAVAIGSYSVLSFFFNVYRDAVDTLFLCYLEDKKINDGSRKLPYQMSKQLMRILNKRNYRGRKDS